MESSPGSRKSDVGVGDDDDHGGIVALDDSAFKMAAPDVSDRGDNLIPRSPPCPSCGSRRRAARRHAAPA
jgi:hypothetical protein